MGQTAAQPMCSAAVYTLSAVTREPATFVRTAMTCSTKRPAQPWSGLETAWLEGRGQRCLSSAAETSRAHLILELRRCSPSLLLSNAAQLTPVPCSNVLDHKQ